MIRQYAAEQLDHASSAAARDDHARHYLALTHTLLADTATPADFDALDRLETETPNVASAGRWLLDEGHVGELLKFFADLPYLDAFAFPPLLIDELGALAIPVIEEPDARTHPGCETACWLVRARAFFVGDLNEYRRASDLALLAGGSDPTPLTNNDAGVVALYDGDTASAIKWGRKGVERARRDADPVTLAFVLGQLSTFESLEDEPSALENAHEAVGLARGTGSTVVTFYPLLGLQNAAAYSDPSQSLAAAEESIRLDRTRRQSFRKLGRGRAAMLQLLSGDLIAGSAMCKEVVRSYADDGERSVLAMAVAGWADSVAFFRSRARNHARSNRGERRHRRVLDVRDNAPSRGLHRPLRKRDRGRPCGGRGTRVRRGRRAAVGHVRPCPRRAHVAQRPAGAGPLTWVDDGGGGM